MQIIPMLDKKHRRSGTPLCHGRNIETAIRKAL